MNARWLPPWRRATQQTERRRRICRDGPCSPASQVVRCSRCPASPPPSAGSARILVIASGADVPDLDPHLGTGYAPAAFYRNLYETLVRVEGNPPRVVPMLAESWTASPDGMEYTFKLNAGAKFNDGSPVNAEAIRYSFNRALRLGRGNAWMISGALDENSITPVDAQTVRMKLIRPFAPFLTVLPWIFIVNPAVVEANKGGDDGAGYLRTNVAGSGAFRITRQEVGNIYEFARVENRLAQRRRQHQRRDLASGARDDDAAPAGPARRGADCAVDLTSEDMDALAGRPGVRLISEPEFRTFSIKMNTRHGPLADIELRQRRLLRLQLPGDAGLRRPRAADGRPAAARHPRP